MVLPADMNERRRNEPRQLDEEEMVVTGALVGGMVGYIIGATAALACIMVPGCVPAIAMAPAVIGGAATGAVVMGVGAEVVAGDDEVDETLLSSPEEVSNNFQQALALHMYRALEARIDAGQIAQMDIVADPWREELLRPDHPKPKKLFETGVATVAVTAGIKVLFMDEDGRIRLRARTVVRSEDETSGITSFVHDFVYLPRKTPEEWRADQGRPVADMLVRSLPHIASRLVAERFYLLKVPAKTAPLGESADETSATLHWGGSGSGGRASKSAGVSPSGVEIALREGTANAQCVSWLMRVGDGHKQNIAPPCLTWQGAGGWISSGSGSTGEHMFQGLAPCTRYAWSLRDVYGEGEGRRVSEWSNWRELQTSCAQTTGGL